MQPMSVRILGIQQFPVSGHQNLHGGFVMVDQSVKALINQVINERLGTGVGWLLNLTLLF